MNFLFTLSCFSKQPMEEFMPVTTPLQMAAGALKYLDKAANSGGFRHFHYIYFKQTQQHVTSAHGN